MIGDVLAVGGERGREFAAENGATMTFWIDSVTDAGGMKYWILFTHGQFHNPVAVIGDGDMRLIAERVIGVQKQIDDLGAAVLAYRKTHKLTQLEFATRCGVSRNYISQIERGKADNLSLAVHRRVSREVAQP